MAIKVMQYEVYYGGLITHTVNKYFSYTRGEKCKKFTDYEKAKAFCEKVGGKIETAYCL